MKPDLHVLRSVVEAILSFLSPQVLEPRRRGRRRRRRQVHNKQKKEKKEKNLIHNKCVQDSSFFFLKRRRKCAIDRKEYLLTRLTASLSCR
jgi:hypothetical protein